MQIQVCGIIPLEDGSKYMRTGSTAAAVDKGRWGEGENPRRGLELKVLESCIHTVLVYRYRWRESLFKPFGYVQWVKRARI